MPELTESMRREMVVAECIARTKGFTLKSASQELRDMCHAIARAVMPAVNSLVDDAIADTAIRVEAHYKERELFHQSRAYQDGYQDGEKGEYNNRYQKERVEWFSVE